MTTQVVVKFSSISDVNTYVDNLDLIALDQNVALEVDIPNWEFPSYYTFGPKTSDATRRLTIRPTSTNNVNKNGLTTLDYVPSGGAQISFIHGRNLNIRPGVIFQDMLINPFLDDNGSAVYSKGRNELLDYDVIFDRCRIRDAANQTGPTMFGGNNSSRLLLLNCLVISEGNPAAVMVAAQDGGTTVINTTFVARGAALGAPVAVQLGNNSGSSGIVAIGFGNNAFNGKAIPNCYANTPQATSGYTVVTTPGGLVVNETNDFTPSVGSPLIGGGADSTKGNIDILSKNRGQTPDAGAKQRTAAVDLPQGTITNIAQTVTTGNKRRVTITGTTANNPTSGVASITPVSLAGNNAVAQNNVVVTFGSGTFTAVFSDDTRVGKYNATITLTNTGGSGVVGGSTGFDVVGAAGVITSQPAPNGQKQSISGTTSGTPDSGTITWKADNGTVQGPFALTLGTNTFSDIDRVLPPGVYSAPVVAFTIPAGTSLPATGGSGVTILGISGNPQTPDSSSSSTVTSVNVSPTSATVISGATQQFTATVLGANSPAQDVTWVKMSGDAVGTMSSTGLYTAGAGVSTARTAVYRATSIQDSTFSADVTVNVPAVTTASITNVVITPDNPTVSGSSTTQFVVNVTATGGASTAGTWSEVGPGSVNSTGLYTAPASSSQVQTSTVTWVSTFDNTKTDSVTITIPATSGTAAVYPPANQVQLGFKYGPTGVEFTGTYVPANGSAEEIANAVWNYQTALSIPKFLAIK